MILNDDDKKILEKLCQESQIGFENVIKLIDTIKEYEFKERRQGIYDELREIIKSDINQKV